MGWEVLLCSGDQAEGVGTAPAVAPLEQGLAQGRNSTITLGHSGLMPGQAQHLWGRLRSYRNSHFFSCVSMLLILLGFWGFFLPDLTFFT